ncbi:MAG: beta-ketoacyl synthase chain length factor [Bdellovibrionales bacterium]|nr:beta-ketoacyl synthase chain length factor [Bdellovibrionales bacterium]
MLKLVAFAKKNFADIEADLSLDKNRKKSHNMILASRTVEEILHQMKEVSGFSENLLDLVFCSGEGEIEQTFEFYKNLAQNRARPILFQNSLHNSTLGSLSLEVPLLSYGMTISNGDISFETALDAALSSQSGNPILIMGVDAFNEEIKFLRNESYQNKVEFVSGACAGMFIPEGHPLFNIMPGPIIKDIKFEMKAEADSFFNYYPSNGLEAIHEHLKTSTLPFSLNRPKGHVVTIICHEN